MRHNKLAVCDHTRNEMIFFECDETTGKELTCVYECKDCQAQWPISLEQAEKDSEYRLKVAFEKVRLSLMQRKKLVHCHG